MKIIKLILITIVIAVLSSCTAASRISKKETNLKEPATQKKDTVQKVIRSIKSFYSENKTTVQIDAGASLRYTAFKLTEPLRLVLDLPDMNVSPKLPKELKISGRLVTAITNQYFKSSNITRIEIWLKKIVPHRIVRRGENTILVELIDSSSKKDTNKKENPAVSSKKEIYKNEKLPIPVISRNNVVKQHKDIPSDQIVPDVTKRATAPAAEPQSHENRSEAAAISVRTDTNTAVNKNIKKRYTGRRISLDFQDAEISNILRFIAEVSRFNIVTSDDVSGKINLKLNNVPWDQALDIILKTKALGMEKDGNIIRIAPLAVLKAEKEETIKTKEVEREARLKAEQARIESMTAKEKTEELFTEVISINYADATDILKNIKKLKSGRGDIDINIRTNTLIIKDIKKNIKLMKSLIKKLDRRTPQVTIEARIVEVTRTLSRELGIQWGGLYNKSTSYSFPDNVTLQGGISPAVSTKDLALVNTAPGGGNFITHMPAAVGSGSGGAISLSLGHLLGSAALDITLSALENSGNGKILSNPKITTEDNMEAIIESGRSIPYATVSQSGTQVQFVNAVISLTVTPHITHDGFISMKIVATKNDADFGNQVQGTPSILTKKAETQVLVKNGDTTVIGGLYTNSSQKSEAAIPWFSKLPLIGWLFRKQTSDNSSTELLIFITPTIINI